MSALDTTLASRAIAALLELLADAGIEATHDPGAFYPQPVGVLVGLPTLTGRGLRSASFSIPILVVSGDPLNTLAAVDRVYAIADAVAETVQAASYRPSSWQGGPNQEPLPAVEVAAAVTTTYEGGA